jgi:hypothetical protein
LTEQESILARSLAEDLSVLEHAEFKALAAQRKAKVVQVAYSFIRYRQLKMVRDPEVAARSHHLLKVLKELPSEPHHVERPERPEKGHKTQMVGGTIGIKEDLAYGQFDYRVTYHDLLDNPEGYPQGAHIAMGNTQVRWLEGDEAYLQRFDFIDIISLSEIDRFFVSPSWHVKTGYEKAFANSNDGRAKETGTYYVKAGIGAATRFFDNTLGYSFFDARLEHNSFYKPFVNTAFGVSVGVLNYNSLGTLRFSTESVYFTSNDEYRVVSALEQNIVLSTNDAIRVGVFHEWHKGYRPYEFSVSYRHHF